MAEIRELTEGETQPFSALTFPAYRHLLDLQPSSRVIEDPALPESDVARTPVALAAFEQGQPAGLLLAMMPNGAVHQEQDAQHNPQLLSLAVSGTFRRRGIGTNIHSVRLATVCSCGGRHSVAPNVRTRHQSPPQGWQPAQS